MWAPAGACKLAVRKRHRVLEQSKAEVTSQNCATGASGSQASVGAVCLSLYHAGGLRQSTLVRSSGFCEWDLQKKGRGGGDRTVLACAKSNRVPLLLVVPVSAS